MASRKLKTLAGTENVIAWTSALDSFTFSSTSLHCALCDLGLFPVRALVTVNLAFLTIVPHAETLRRRKLLGQTPLGCILHAAEKGCRAGRLPVPEDMSSSQPMQCSEPFQARQAMITLMEAFCGVAAVRRFGSIIMTWRRVALISSVG